MKIQLRNIAISGLFVVLAIASAQAQTSSRAEVYIPFDFSAGTAKLKAGVYTVKRSTGTILASTLRWVMTTPLGSAVAPDVKMISATSSRDSGISGRSGGGASVHVSSCSFQMGGPGEPGEFGVPGINVVFMMAAIGGTSCPISTSFAATMPLTRERKSGDAR